MKKVLTIIGWILIGAIAAGIGTGFFLYQSNTDRAKLVAATEEAKRRSEELAQGSKKLAEEANTKLNTASEEIRSAQELIRQYDEEHALLAKADPLVRTRTSANWKEWINIPLGYTIRLPATFGNAGNELLFDFDWLRIQPYDAGRESLWHAQASSTGDVVYFVDGHLLVGTRGNTWILRDQSGASSTMLIWAEPKNIQDERILLEALATLTFRR